MADLLAKGAAWLDDQRTRHMSRSVVYQRGADTVEVAATIGRTVFEQADEFGVISKTESRDFLVLASALVLAGAPVTPRRGDRVRETDGTKVFVYEVMAPGSEPPFRFSDPFRRTLRIHTKHVASEDAPPP